jgi:hypothetical protein
MNAMRFRWGLWVMAAVLLAAIPTAARGANAVAEPFNAAPDPAWWTLGGDAACDAASQSIFLTHAVNDQTGSIFWPWKFRTDWFSASFDFWIGGGTGGEGFAFTWVKEKNFFGEGGSSLGVGGLDGYALRFDTGTNQEGSGPNYFAMGITDSGDQPFTDLYYSFGPSVFLTDAYGVRRLHEESYQPGDNVRHQTLSYSLVVPADSSSRIRFEGTLTFDDTTVGIWGDHQRGEALYPVPSPPRNLTVEMLQAAHLSWSPPETEGVASYRIYRSVNGGPYELIASTTSTTYTDKWVQPGNNYSYRVTAVNVQYLEGEPTAPTPPVSVMTTMEIREAEDFNYGGGQFPPYQNCPPAIESPDGTIGTPQEYDYYHPNKGPKIYPPPWPEPLLYRADAPWIITVEEADDPGVFATIISYIDPGSWYRYTFNVREAGWVKFEFRAASPGGGALAAYWDENSNGEEQLIGKVRFTTGNWYIFTWALMEEQIQTPAGVHTLRIQSVGGNLNFDKIAIQWNAPPPSRKTIWADDFESYTTTADVFSPTAGGWTRGLTGNHDGSWTLWDTAGPPLGNEPANIREMHNKYMISNSDLSGEGVLIDEEMLSPEVDCTGWTKLRLNFNKNYRIYVGDPDRTQTAEVSIRSFEPETGWGGWATLMRLQFADVPVYGEILSDPEVHDLSAYDGKKIQLKFHYYDAEYDYWFAIDNIRVSGFSPPPEPPPITSRIIVKDDTVELCLDPYPAPDPWTILSVEYCDDLVEGNWLPIPNWPPVESGCIADDIRGVRQRFYRIKAE